MTVRQFAAVVTLVLGLAGPATAQIAGPPFVFTSGTVISPTEVNTNFATLYANALNRTGGTMTGPLLFSADNNHDVGANGTTRPRDLWLARNATIGGTLAVTGASTFTGAVTISTGGIAEAAITNGTLLARVADTETISGRWTMTNARGLEVSNTTPALWLSETGAAVNAGKWQMNADAGLFTFQAVNDAENATGSVFQVARTGTTVGAMTLGPTQLLMTAGAVATPAYSFSSDTDTGLYSTGADSIGIATGGTLRWTVGSGGNLTANGATRVLLASGSNASPSLSFSADTDSGLFWDPVSSSVSISINGSDSYQFAAAGATLTTTTITGSLTMGGAAPVRLASVVFASLPGAPTNGDLIYCSNCTIASPCAGAGTGALAKRLNSQWVCN